MVWSNLLLRGEVGAGAQGDQDVVGLVPGSAGNVLVRQHGAGAHLGVQGGRDAHRGQGSGADDPRGERARSPVGDRDDVADVLVQLREGHRAEHHLPLSLQAVAGQQRGRDRRVRVRAEDRDGHAVDLRGAEPDARPRRDLRVVVEDGRRLVVVDGNDP